MARNGVGVYQLPTGQPVVTGTTISSTVFNVLTADLANALTTSIATDGQTAMAANLPMGGFKATGLGAGTVAGDAMRFEQTAAQGINTDITALNALTAINGGQVSGFRNILMNGAFAINQRVVAGAVVLAAGAHGHDGWKAGTGGCSYTFATVGTTTTLTISAGSLVQVIKGSNVAQAAHIASHTGTAQGRVLAGSYAASPFAVTATAGSNLTMEYGIGTLTKVQVERGTTATSYEFKPENIELQHCQRRFWKSFRQNLAPSFTAGLSTGEIQFYSAVAGAINSGIQVNFPATMDAAPTTVTLYNPGAANGQVLTNGIGDWTASGVSSSTDRGFTISGVQPGGAGVGSLNLIHATAEVSL